MVDDSEVGGGTYGRCFVPSEVSRNSFTPLHPNMAHASFITVENTRQFLPLFFLIFSSYNIFSYFFFIVLVPSKVDAALAAACNFYYAIFLRGVFLRGRWVLGDTQDANFFVVS